MKNFGEVFYSQIVRLVDEAAKVEERINKTNEKIFSHFGLINYEDIIQYNLKIPHDQIKKEFEELIVELAIHATEYNQTNSKFFGREYLIEKVD